MHIQECNVHFLLHSGELWEGPFHAWRSTPLGSQEENMSLTAVLPSTNKQIPVLQTACLLLHFLREVHYFINGVLRMLVYSSMLRLSHSTSAASTFALWFYSWCWKYLLPQ